jgi:hypothetical protein
VRQAPAPYQAGKAECRKSVTGSYLIVVTSAFPGETGAFTLELAPGSRITPTSPSNVWNPA